ncbi:hypothetical protein SCAR479_06287 [Seiridium cardinale]|uniref:Secreted protein n=1 Tax=Seiridium cardinale TaxID=138064 RepID=A0ABR2XSU2_9PEZI
MIPWKSAATTSSLWLLLRMLSGLCDLRSRRALGDTAAEHSDQTIMWKHTRSISTIVEFCPYRKVHETLRGLSTNRGMMSSMTPVRWNWWPPHSTLVNSYLPGSIHLKSWSARNTQSSDKVVLFHSAWPNDIPDLLERAERALDRMPVPRADEDSP